MSNTTTWNTPFGSPQTPVGTSSGGTTWSTPFGSPQTPVGTSSGGTTWSTPFGTPQGTGRSTGRSGNRRTVPLPAQLPNGSTAHIERLYNEAKELNTWLETTDRIQLVQSSGTPPNSYIINLNVKGVEGISGGRTVYRDQHTIEITVPPGYTNGEKLRVQIKTPIFHPNLGSYICFGNDAGSDSLLVRISTVARMIVYDIYNPNSPLNDSAKQWAIANRSLFPLDEVLLPPAI